jgi:glyoxylase-like metal-dependent hydrolase (beta-lactamase superfamily II)
VAKLSIVKVKLDREVNCYVVSCGSTKEAVVIDPGLPVEKIAEQLKGLKVRYILATHCHPGHVGGKDDLKELVGGETGLHPADAKQFLRSADRYLIDGDELEFGEFKVTVLHTPGHTPGSKCFLIAKHKLLRLPLPTALYPGHGPASSLERELAQNPIFRGAPAPR